MSVPHLLLVDDSEAALALERSALAQHYLLSTAMDGLEALDCVRRTRPAAVLLDLSMPRMDGEAVLAQMRDDPELAAIPVIVVSSEKERGEACLARGAAAFVHKPYRKDVLLVTVGRVLAEVHERSRQGSIAVLPIRIAHLELGVELDAVRTVLSMTETLPLPSDHGYVAAYFEMYGEPVCVLDLATRLGAAHAEPLIERKLIVLVGSTPAIALCVDRVHEPVELPLASVARLPRADAAPGPDADLASALAAAVADPLPVFDPRALIPPGLLDELAVLVAYARNANLDADGDVI